MKWYIKKTERGDINTHTHTDTCTHTNTHTHTNRRRHKPTYDEYEKNTANVDLRDKHSSFRTRANRRYYDQGVHMCGFSGSLHQGLTVYKLYGSILCMLAEPQDRTENFRF